MASRARFPARTALFGAAGSERLLAPELRAGCRAGRALHLDEAGLEDPMDGTPLDRATVLTLRGYTANQLLRDIDATSMAHSLEVRVPLLDRAVADLALSLPDGSKLGSADVLGPAAGGTYRRTGAKRILIDAFRHLLPEGIAEQAKRGFALPVGAWLLGPLAEPLAECLSEAAVRRRGLLAPGQVSGVRRRFERGEVSCSAPWLLMVL